MYLLKFFILNDGAQYVNCFIFHEVDEVKVERRTEDFEGTHWYKAVVDIGQITKNVHGICIPADLCVPLHGRVFAPVAQVAATVDRLFLLLTFELR